jgi:putative pyruvate formate lyase activating enzyme
LNLYSADLNYNPMSTFAGSLKQCICCPRECGADRTIAGNGYCGTDAGFSISSIVVHRGEEPVISGPKGICNIFFTGCNLHCTYCQNYQISRPDSPKKYWTIDKIIDLIRSSMEQGIRAVGFVSASHVVPQVKAIILAIHTAGLYPILVYNTNAYEKTDTIRSLEGIIDIYLPDFKYITPALSSFFSGAEDYPEYASAAIAEMYHQKGSTLIIGDDGQAESGLLIRHLIIPGHTGESKKVLRHIAEEISTGVHISLMSQYFPAAEACDIPALNQTLSQQDYIAVLEAFDSLGFRHGYLQELESHKNFRPDFSFREPFEPRTGDTVS